MGVKEDVDALYWAYPRHLEPKPAKRAIEGALKKASFAELLDAVTEFAAIVNVMDKDQKRFVPYPATWFNAERWLEDRDEWRLQYGKSKPSQPKPEPVGETFKRLGLGQKR